MFCRRYSLEYERLDPDRLKHVVALDGVGGGASGRFYTHSLDRSDTASVMVVTVNEYPVPFLPPCLARVFAASPPVWLCGLDSIG